MATGPITPFPPYLGTTGNLFPKFFPGAGGNASSHRFGIGVIASLASDVTAELTFAMPPAIPAGQLKLMVRALALATLGVAKLTVSDGTAGAGADPSAVTLTPETQATFTWGPATSGVFIDNKISLSATPGGNDCLIVAATFNTTGWTLAQEACFLFWVLWE